MDRVKSRTLGPVGRTQARLKGRTPGFKPGAGSSSDHAILFGTVDIQTKLRATTSGDFRRVVLGIVVMSFFVVVVNRIFWRPLYWYAERKYRLT